MREHDLQAPHRVGHAHGPKAHDGTITTAAPDVMWGTDMTATVTVGEGAAFVFVAVDHCPTECIGLHRPSAGPDLRPWSRSARASAPASARLARASPAGCVFGTPPFQQEVAFFGIESFVREPEGNGVAERFIRTLTTPSRSSAWPYSNNEQWMLEKYHYQSPARCDVTSSHANTVKPLSKNPGALQFQNG